MRRFAAVLPAMAVVAMGCGGGEGGSADADAGPDEVETYTPPVIWGLSVVAEGDVGRHLRLDADADGNLGIAFYGTVGREGEPCVEIGDDPPNKFFWPLTYAWPEGDGWGSELIADVLHVGQPTGIDFRFAPDGTPTVIALTGPPKPPLAAFCGANDVGVFRRTAPGQWDVETAVAESNEAPVPAGTDAELARASTYGTVVGYWPGLGFDPQGGLLVAYKDVHSGSIQRDDLARADLELAWKRGGGWDHLMLDMGRGAGNYNAVAFDDQGRPLVLYFNPMDVTENTGYGLWLARSSDAGATWESVQLLIAETEERPSLDVDPHDGTVRVAYFHGGNALPYLAELKDPEAFTELDEGWEVDDLGDYRYAEGLHPSVAVDPDGRVAVVYYRCGRATDGVEDCSPANDAVVFAWRDGSAWEHEVIDKGTEGSCGNYPNLRFDDQGRAIVAYQCTRLEGGKLVEQVKIGLREPLP